MTDQAEKSARSSRDLATMALILGGLVLGAAVGVGVGDGLSLAQAHHARWSDSLALVMAAIFGGSGALMLAMMTSARGRALAVDPGGPLSSRRIGGTRLLVAVCQAMVLVLAGTMLAAAPLVQLAHGTLSGHGLALMAAIVLLFALQSGLNLLIWRHSDEVERRAIAQTGAVCFWLFQGLLFLWASGERLAVLPAATAWDMLSVMMAGYFVIASVAVVRRGLAG